MKSLRVIISKMEKFINQIISLEKQLYESFVKLEKLNDAEQKRKELSASLVERDAKISYLRGKIDEIESLDNRCVYLKSLLKPSLKDTLNVISVFFDTSYYSKTYVVNKRLSKLHFFFIGRKKFYNITPYVDLNFLKKRYGIVELDIINYLKAGVLLGIDPNEFFSSNWYRKKNVDLTVNSGNPLAHYVKSGWKERNSPSLAFDIQKYLDHHEDVKIAGVEPLKHFLTRGIVERREVFKHD